STNRPRKISTSIMAAISPIGGSPSVAVVSTTPVLAPENDRICEKVIGPRMVNRIIPGVAAVPRRALGSGSRVRERCDARGRRVRIAADSVGGAQPAHMDATTTTKIETSGTTYWKKGRNFSQP